MKEIIDSYRTLAKASEESLFKEKGSKFFGYAFPVTKEAEIKEIIVQIKKEHYAARHWCYAWKLGVEQVQYRVNDDGEPSNSAGQPIYGQILSAEITNVLVVIVRYFGGVKLGVGGLVRAYKAAAELTIENSEIVEKIIEEELVLVFEYAHMNKVMRLVKQLNVTIQQQEMALNCQLTLSIKKSEYAQVKSAFEKLHFLSIPKNEE
ncbi:IMPACT family protein [Flavicella sediminum]|uniref:IMPACT family protein n=1 Tax=Flavicella sediminum TaxID=2585141 RepID=UPI0037444F8C